MTIRGETRDFYEEIPCNARLATDVVTNACLLNINNLDTDAMYTQRDVDNGKGV